MDDIDVAGEVDCDLSALLGGILAALEGHEASFQKLKSNYTELAQMLMTGTVGLPPLIVQACLTGANDTNCVSASQTALPEDAEQITPKSSRPLYGPGSHSEEQSVHRKKASSRQKRPSLRRPSLLGKDEVRETEPSIEAPQQKLYGCVAPVVMSIQFEVFMALTIIANAVTMSARLQMQGLHEAYELGLRHDDGNWSSHKERFEWTEYIFNIVYMLELVLRLWVHGKYFTRHFVNVLDAVIVLAGCLDTFVMQPQHIKMANVSVLRLIRLSHIFRIAKVLVLSEHLSEMRTLLRTLRLGIKGMFHSMLLLSGVIVAGGILMAQLAMIWIGDEGVKVETRVWLHEAFGTTAAATYTMFECTFTGGWRFYSRPLIEEVDYKFALFWVCWIVFVNFMTMRIVGALFLKQTMDVAAVDAERLAMSNMKRKDMFAGAIRDIFVTVDTSGDGAISIEEFGVMLQDQHVLKKFRRLGLDEDELFALFSVLSDDDGCADYEEFLNGALKMNSSARTIDSVQVMHSQLSIRRDICQLLEYMEPLKKLMADRIL